MQLVQGEGALNAESGGVEPLQIDRAVSRRSDARDHGQACVDRSPSFSGIGNAHLDEILHGARLSPLKLTRALADDEVARLYESTRATLLLWIERLQRRSQGRVSGEGHGLPRRDGGPRPLQAAVSGLRNASAANCVPTTSATTALAARRAVVCSPIARCRVCSEKAGLERLRRVASAFRRTAAEAGRYIGQDLSTGREGSLAHSLHDPAYNLAPCSPACSSATRFWQAVTPEPQ